MPRTRRPPSASAPVYQDDELPLGVDLGLLVDSADVDSHGAFGHAWGTKALTMTPSLKVSPSVLNDGKYGRWPIMYYNMDGGTTLFWLALIIVTLACTLWCADKANRKGYPIALGVLLSFFLGIIGLVVVLALPDKEADKTAQAPDKLLKYKELLDEGILTQAEFERKKSELL